LQYSVESALKPPIKPKSMPPHPAKREITLYEGASRPKGESLT
jgi:hypothetical protein